MFLSGVCFLLACHKATHNHTTFFYFQIVHKCCYCPYQHSSMFYYKRHMREHVTDVGKMKCWVCGQDFKEVRYWQVHYDHKHLTLSETGLQHGKVQDVTETGIQHGRENAMQPGPSHAPAQHQLGDIPGESMDVENTSCCDGEDRVALFLGTLRAEHLLSHALISYIAENILSITEDMTAHAVPINVGKKPGSIHALRELKSKGSLARHIHNYMPYIPPESRNISCESGDTTIYYIPPSKMLVCLLDNKAICQNGSVTLTLYMDEFGTSDPLRGKVLQNKMMGLYYRVDAPVYSAKADDILLALICHSTTIKKHGLSAVVAPVVEDLKTIMQGGLMWEGHIIQVNVRCVCADNLGVHQIAGYQETFYRGARPCRYCHAVYDEFRVKLSPDAVELRTKQQYEEELKALEESGFAEDVCRRYGVKSKCPFQALPGFEVTEMFPPDIAHDIFEGVLHNLMVLILTHLIVKMKVFTVHEFNKMVIGFRTARCDRGHKPAAARLSNKNVTLKMTAVECWTMGRLLPLVIGKYVPHGMEEWMLYVEFLQVLELICAPEISDVKINQLEEMISAWIVKFVRLFPAKSVTPKMHYLVHYSDQIRRHGPLRYCWTLAFETKHQLFKKQTRQLKSRRNACKMMTERHQERLALLLAKSSSGPVTVMGKKLAMEKVAGMPDELVDGSHVFYTKCSLGNVVYHADDVIVVANTDNTCSLLQIKMFESANDTGPVQHIHGDILVVDSFQKHWNSFAVSQGNHRRMPVTDLGDFQALGSYQSQGKALIPLRHSLKSMIRFGKW